MKNTHVLLALLAFTICSCGTNKEVSQIYDNENILTTHQEKHLNAIISKFQKNTENRIFILTSKDIGICENALEYASSFGKEQGIFSYGEAKELVIFVSKNMKITSLATGSKTDRSLKDEISEQIIDSCMIPLFKEDKYFDGLKVAVKESIKNWN